MRAHALGELPSNRNLTSAEIYCSAWGEVNKHVDFAIRQDELFYLRTIALSLDDDLASLLLLKKLKMARKFAAAEDEPQVVGMNSYVELRFGEGNRRFCQLLHPTVCASSFGLSIGSRLGAGVVGVRAGEVLLWPDEDGSPRDLHVIAVNNTRGRKAQLLPPDDLPPSTA